MIRNKPGRKPEERPGDTPDLPARVAALEAAVAALQQQLVSYQQQMAAHIAADIATH